MGGDGTIEERYAAARREAVLLAGAPGELTQRAAVYHRVYRDSRGNHVFPLLAAHGALWGRGHFARGMRVGRALSFLDPPALRRPRLAALAAFADAFRNINRRVCIEVYASWAFTAESGECAGADRLLDPVLLDALNRCHRATRRGPAMSRAERAALFEAFFRWEQVAVVGPAVQAAVAAFDWRRVRRLALRPSIRFSYMPRRDALRFSAFDDMAERVEKGLRAYDIAEDAGLDAVEAALDRYGILPAGLLRDEGTAFEALRARVLAGPAPGGPPETSRWAAVSPAADAAPHAFGRGHHTLAARMR